MLDTSFWDRVYLLLLGQRLIVCRTLRVGLPARRTQTILISAQTVPAEAANLVATSAGVEVDVIHL